MAMKWPVSMLADWELKDLISEGSREAESELNQRIIARKRIRGIDPIARIISYYREYAK